MFKNMGGNIPVGDVLGNIFPGMTLIYLFIYFRYTLFIDENH